MKCNFHFEDMQEKDQTNKKMCTMLWKKNQRKPESKVKSKYKFSHNKLVEIK